MYTYEDIQKVENLMAKADMLETEQWRSLVNNLITDWLHMHFQIESLQMELNIKRVENKETIDYAEDFNYFGC